MRFTVGVEVAHSTHMYISAHLAVFFVMGEIALTDARTQLAEVVDQARIAHEPVHLTRPGRRVAAVIGAAELDRLIEAAEDLDDIRAAGAARAELSDAGAEPIPTVKVGLGLD